MTTNSHFEKFLNLDGISMTVDGIRFKINADCRKAVYPYPHRSIYLDAEYFDDQENRTFLIDLTRSESSLCAKILTRLEKRLAKKD